MMLPNTLIRSYLNALDDLLGKNGVNTILNHSGLSDWIENYPPHDLTKAVPFEAFSKIQSSLDDIYGERTGQNLSRRASRTSFLDIGAELINRAGHAASEDISNEGIQDTLDTFVSLFDDGTGAVYWSGEDEKIVIYFVTCPCCIDRKSQTPICHACAGWIEGFLTQLALGDRVQVTEASCLASDDESCSFLIQPG
jgi:predicted hydrocarbon binding protein